MSGIEFSVFDHVEPLPGVPLDRLYRDRLAQIEYLDAAGFYGYHQAEHHSPANHTAAPSQNVFLAAVSQRTARLRLIPTVYVLPVHHPLRLIEEICMVDALSDGRLEFAVGAGGVLEAYFWGQEGDPELNRARFEEVLPGGLGTGILAGLNVIAGSPETMRAFMEESATIGANYMVCAFQFGSLTHEQAMRSIRLFSEEVMPHYKRAEAVVGRW